MWKPKWARRETAKGASSTPKFKRYDGTGVCDVCNANLTPGEAFLVPTKVFWDSRKYRAYLSDSPQARIMIQMAGVTVDQHIAMQRQRDKSENSAICPNCIDLFP